MCLICVIFSLSHSLSSHSHPLRSGDRPLPYAGEHGRLHRTLRKGFWRSIQTGGEGSERGQSIVQLCHLTLDDWLSEREHDWMLPLREITCETHASFMREQRGVREGKLDGRQKGQSAHLCDQTLFSLSLLFIILFLDFFSFFLFLLNVFSSFILSFSRSLLSLVGGVFGEQFSEKSKICSQSGCWLQLAHSLGLSSWRHEPSRLLTRSLSRFLSHPLKIFIFRSLSLSLISCLTWAFIILFFFVSRFLWILLSPPGNKDKKMRTLRFEEAGRRTAQRDNQCAKIYQERERETVKEEETKESKN